MLLGGAAGLAQDAPAACEAAVTALNDHGLERITVTSPCRRNERISARYGVLRQDAVFSDEGVARIFVALTSERGPIILHYKDNKEYSVTVDTASLSAVYRITLQWEAPVDLNLHVVEPGGRIASGGDATVGHSPEQFSLRGRLDLDDDGMGLSPFQESYVFPNRLERPSDIFTVYVENATRGRIPSGPHCGNGEYAQIDFTLIIADRSAVPRKHQFKLPSLPCGQVLDDRTYFFRPHL